LCCCVFYLSLITRTCDVSRFRFAKRRLFKPPRETRRSSPSGELHHSRPPSMITYKLCFHPCFCVSFLSLRQKSQIFATSLVRGRQTSLFYTKQKWCKNLLPQNKRDVFRFRAAKRRLSKPPRETRRSSLLRTPPFASTIYRHHPNGWCFLY